VTDEKPVRAGARAALPLVVPTIALGVSFGLLAEPVMGSAAPIVMSILVFSGGAQFAALSVLQANGTAAAAIGAGLLMNTRWLPMSFALTPSLRGGRPRRALEAQAIVDASFVLSDRRDGTFDRGLLIGATIPQASSWIAGTIIGVVASGSFDDPDKFGLDAVFPAFYVTLLLAEAKGRRALTAAAIAAVVTLALMTFAPPGVPVIAASAAALIGLRRR
jgi:predicted branched-subunit amino acid permease